MQDYYLYKTAPRTSCLHYSVRRLPVLTRRRVVMVHAFYRSLLNILFDCNEVDVARAQLQWWRDQVLRISDSKPDHPILIELQKHLDLSQSQALMFEIINGIESYLDEPIFMNDTDLYHFFAKTVGARELIILKNNDDQTDQPQLASFAYQIGAGIELIHQIRNLYQYISKGHFIFTQNDLDRSQAELKDFHQHNPTDKVQYFLQLQAQKARHYCSQAWRLSIKLEPNLYQYYANYSKLYLKTLQAIEKDDLAVVLSRYVQLNPLNKLWQTLKK